MKFEIGKVSVFELLLEAFNVFDTPQYAQPNNVVIDPNFGKITGTRLNTERQIQLAGRVIF